jgi:hypothetical protein
MSEPGGPEFEKARRLRNLFIAWALVGFMVLVFLVTIAKMKGAG